MSIGPYEWQRCKPKYAWGWYLPLGAILVSNGHPIKSCDYYSLAVGKELRGDWWRLEEFLAILAFAAPELSINHIAKTTFALGATVSLYDTLQNLHTVWFNNAMMTGDPRGYSNWALMEFVGPPAPTWHVWITDFANQGYLLNAGAGYTTVYNDPALMQHTRWPEGLYVPTGRIWRDDFTGGWSPVSQNWMGAECDGGLSYKHWASNGGP